jgi:hypothetical protein
MRKCRRLNTLRIENYLPRSLEDVEVWQRVHKDCALTLQRVLHSTLFASPHHDRLE